MKKILFIALAAIFSGCATHRVQWCEWSNPLFPEVTSTFTIDGKLIGLRDDGIVVWKEKTK